MKLTPRNVKFAWKYRRALWKYRGLIRHRKAIAGGALAAAGALAAVVLTRKARGMSGAPAA